MTRARENSITSAISGIVAGKNFVINGGFDIWQRGTTGTNNATSAAGCNADRWSNYLGSGAITISRQSTGDSTILPNIQYCARIQRNSGNTAAGNFFMLQPFESVNSIPLAGKTVTLSFYARKGANYSGGNLAINLTSGTGTDQNPYNGMTGGVNAIDAAAVLTTSWQRFTYTGTVPTNCNQLAIDFYFTTSGTAGAADYWELTGVQLEVGSIATPFSRAGGNIGAGLALCQRYYQKSYDTDGVPGNNSGSGKINFNTPNRTDQYAIEFNTNFKVTMRGTPSVSIFSPVTGTSGRVRDEASGNDRAAIAKNIGQNTAQIEGDSGVTTTANGLHSVQWVASAEL